MTVLLYACVFGFAGVWFHLLLFGVVRLSSKACYVCSVYVVGSVGFVVCGLLRVVCCVFFVVVNLNCLNVGCCA